MSVLVAYASKHGSTQGIAERIAERLRLGGVEAQAVAVRDVRQPEAYEAFVVGSAAYMFHWLGSASTFVKRNQALLSSRPVWLFSSGPVGADKIDAQGRDVREQCVPKEMPALMARLGARDHAVFFGAFDPDAPRHGLVERLTFMLPAARAAFPRGDFRDWPEIEAWADRIGAELAAVADPAPVAAPAPVAPPAPVAARG